MKNIKGFTLIEVLITSIIMVIVITSTVMFITTGYSLSNKNFALSQAQNKLNVIQEKIYYSIRNAGLVQFVPGIPTKIEIYDRSIPPLPNPIIILHKSGNSLEMLTGNGSGIPSKATNLSADCDSIGWVFDKSLTNPNQINFSCTIKVKKGQEIATISNNVLVSHYRSLAVATP